MLPRRSKKSVHFHRALVTPKLCPGEQRQTQIDGGGIHCIDGCGQLQIQRLRTIQLARHADQHAAEVGEDPPVAMLVGMGKIVARDLAAKAHVIQLRLLRAQTGLDVAQALAIGQLRECQTQELIQTREVLDFVVAAIMLHAATKFVQRQKVHQLCKHRATGIHVPPSASGRWASEYRKNSNRFWPFWDATRSAPTSCGKA